MRVVGAILILAAIVGSASAAAMTQDDSIVLADSAPANWGGHGSWGHGSRGGGNHDDGGYGDGGNSGGSIVADPYPDGPVDYPYPDAPLPIPNTPGQPIGGGQNALTASPPLPLWYYCDKPSGYFPYVKTCAGDWQGIPPAPPPPGSGPPISDVTWDYCEDAKGYYPYVATCRRHWVAVLASVPDVEVPLDRPPAIGMWFYCTEAKGYFPYVRDCSETWRMMPAVPPQNLASAPKNTAAVR